jgi:hypothetical protein
MMRRQQTAAAAQQNSGGKEHQHSGNFFHSLISPFEGGLFRPHHFFLRGAANNRKQPMFSA